MKEKKFTYKSIRHLLSIGLTFCSGFAFSQAGNVGINTPTPQKTLHVNGSLQVTNEFNLGGTASTAGSPGLTNQVLVSQGAGNPVIWKNVSDLIPSNTYTLKLFKDAVTTYNYLTSSQVNVSVLLGTVAGVTISKPVNTVVVYLDVDAYSYQLYDQSAIAYFLKTSITQGATEISVQSSQLLILSGTLFADSRNPNFKSFVYKNLPVGTYNVNLFGNRQNSAGPNASKNLEFIPGNIHVYLYESN
ncbi:MULTISPECIES: hypothetical protein [unclassified Chryseobacterium]|uniref:hypothetical protein n=1 Tax=unclassified Chryseobacterium TaxID=2593645 RepID=UPI001AE5378F|nr:MULTISPECIES: hypothetical protein [unclassified Chryseobacterium]MBP1165634.1 hypothetical protein [Chryseobacterium sp. PvR013]MDR4894434.1 hypothetical protein [Chryseobacterium sp. CFS7]